MKLTEYIQQQVCGGPFELEQGGITIVVGCPSCTKEIAPEVERFSEDHYGVQFEQDCLDFMVYDEFDQEVAWAEEVLTGPEGWVKVVTQPGHFCPCGADSMVCRTKIYGVNYRVERKP